MEEKKISSSDGIFNSVLKTKAHKLFKMVIANKPDYFFYISGSRPWFGYKILSTDKSYITSVILLFLLVTVHCAFFTYLVSDELNKAHIIKKPSSRER